MDEAKNNIDSLFPAKLSESTEKADQSQKEQRRSWATCTPVRATADIWRHFRVYTDNRCPDLAVCMYCRAEVPRGKDRSTTPLRSHLQHHHRDDLIENSLDSLRGEGNGSDFYGRGKGEFGAEPSMTLLDSYLKMVVYNHLNLDLCESPCFKRLIKTANPRSTVPDLRNVKQRMSEAETQIKSLVKTYFKSQRFAISSHIWTSNENISYRMFSIHGINESWDLISLPLNVSKLPSSNDLESDIKILLESNYFDVAQLTAVVMDSTNSAVSSRTVFGVPSFNCLNSIINRITNIFFAKDGVSDALQKSNLISVKFQKNSMELCKLDLYSQRIGLDPRPTVPDNVKTWWSCYIHCKRMIELQTPIRTVCDIHSYHSALSDSEWQVIKAAVLLLEPFIAVYRLLQGERHVTLSLVPFLISQITSGLQYACTEHVLSEDFICIARSMLLEVNICFGNGSSKELPPPVVMAAALDPRTKSLAGIPQIEHEEVWSRVVIAVRDLVLTDIYQNRKNTVLQNQVKVETAEDSHLRNDGLFALLAGSHSPNSNEYSVANSMSSEDIVGMAERRAKWEVDQFRLAPILSHEEVSRSNPLEWYRDRELLFPAVARLAIQVLGIPAVTSMETLTETGIATLKERKNLTAEYTVQYSFLEAANWPDVLLNPKNIAAVVASGHEVGKSVMSKSRKKSSDKISGHGRSKILSPISEDSPPSALNGSDASGNIHEKRHLLNVDNKQGECMKRRKEDTNDCMSMLKNRNDQNASSDISQSSSSHLLLS